MSSVKTVVDETSSLHEVMPTGAPPGTSDYSIKLFVSPSFTEKRGRDGLMSVYECDFTASEFAAAVDQDPLDVVKMFKPPQLGIHEGSSLFQYCKDSYLFRFDVYNQSAERAKQSRFKGDQLDAQFYFMITRNETKETIYAQSSIRNMQTYPEAFDISPAWYFFN